MFTIRAYRCSFAGVHIGSYNQKEQEKINKLTSRSYPHSSVFSNIRAMLVVLVIGAGFYPPL